MGLELGYLILGFAICNLIGALQEAKHDNKMALRTKGNSAVDLPPLLR